MARQRVLSGARPTGPLHIGNYHGAVKNWVDLQDKYDCYFFVADWHSLTTEYADPKGIADWTNEVILDWLSAGLDPKKATLFIQSKILEHAEFHLLLSMITPLGWLNRVPSYKEMRQQLKDRDLDTYGFLGYPVLQAADIVMYSASFVPVGEDQVAHVELTREIVRRFNFIYKNEILVEPESLLTPTPKVPGLDGRKMSKSYGNCIYMSDDAETVKRKIMPAITDPARMKRDDRGDPDVCIIHDYHRLYSPGRIIEWCEDGCRSAGIGCVDCKKGLLEYMNGYWEPIRKKRAELKKRPDYIADVMADGCKRAQVEAQNTMKEVRRVMGI